MRHLLRRPPTILGAFSAAPAIGAVAAAGAAALVVAQLHPNVVLSADQSTPRPGATVLSAGLYHASVTGSDCSDRTVGLVPTDDVATAFPLPGDVVLLQPLGSPITSFDYELDFTVAATKSYRLAIFDAVGLDRGGGGCSHLRVTITR